MCSSCSENVRFSYVGRMFCPFLTSVLAGTSRTVISVNRPFIIRYISGKRAFFPLHFRYSCGHCLPSMSHIPIARASSGRGDKFCHRITKFCTLFVRLPSVTYPFPGVTKPLGQWVLLPIENRIFKGTKFF